MIFQRDQLWTHVVSAGQNKIYFKKCGAIALTIGQIVVLRTVAPTYLRSSCKVTNSIERPKFYFQNIPSPKPSMQANLICNYLWHGPIFSASTLTCLDDRCMCCSLQVREKGFCPGLLMTVDASQATPLPKKYKRINHLTVIFYSFHIMNNNCIYAITK